MGLRILSPVNETTKHKEEDGKMNLYELKKPQQWKAGSVGGKPFYFDCCDCGTKEPVIKGYLAAGPTLEQIAVIPLKNGFFHMALYCASCFDKQQRMADAANSFEEQNPTEPLDATREGSVMHGLIHA